MRAQHENIESKLLSANAALKNYKMFLKKKSISTCWGKKHISVRILGIV